MATNYLKTKGLSGSEAHRLDQYISKISIAMETLAFIKEYRTPSAFRAFARIYIQVVGALYGPYYIHLAKGDSGAESNLGLACAYGE